MIAEHAAVSLLLERSADVNLVDVSPHTQEPFACDPRGGLSERGLLCVLTTTERLEEAARSALCDGLADAGAAAAGGRGSQLLTQTHRNSIAGDFSDILLVVTDTAMDQAGRTAAQHHSHHRRLQLGLFSEHN